MRRICLASNRRRAVPYEKAEMSEMARSFYADNKRVRNNRIKEELGVRSCPGPQSLCGSTGLLMPVDLPRQRVRGADHLICWTLLGRGNL